MGIIETPVNLNDTAAWERCIQILRDGREGMDPDEYDATMILFQSGRTASLERPPEIAPGGIRKRLTRMNEQALADDNGHSPRGRAPTLVPAARFAADATYGKR